MSRSVIPDVGPLQRQKLAFLSELKGWHPAQTSFRSAPGSWCALEVLDHVVKAERGILADIQWNLVRANHVPLSDRIGSNLLIWFMRTPLRVRVPGPLSQCCPALILICQRSSQPGAILKRASRNGSKIFASILMQWPRFTTPLVAG